MKALSILFLTLISTGIAAAQESQPSVDPRLCQAQLAQTENELIPLLRGMNLANAQLKVMTQDKQDMLRHIAELEKRVSETTGKAGDAKPNVDSQHE